MKIENDVLKGPQVKIKNSPNHGGSFEQGRPDSIILHYTAGSSAESSVETLCNPNVKASAHLVVGRDGVIFQLVPFTTIAWHAGQSSYGGRSGFNKYSIGIEMDNAGKLTKSGENFIAWFGKEYGPNEAIEAVHRNESQPAYWHSYPEQQISTVRAVCELLVDAYGITEILGHEEIAPSRKIDPGPAFPLDKLRDRIFYADRSVDEPDQGTVTETTGIVTASMLNIRSAPSRSASTVAKPLGRGKMAHILEESGGWYKVRMDTTGWVKKDYIRT